MPKERFAPEKIRHPDGVVRSVCPYCGVGCQMDLHVADNTVIRVTSPDIELDTPNQGSTCVKGRFGYDFPQHRDRLTKPLIRKGWVREGGRWVWRAPSGEPRRGGPWQTIRPFCKQSTWWACSLTTDRSCETMRIVAPVFRLISPSRS